ncbi:MAG: ParB/RepB/Spo0J family partition protein [Gammaproteobacteria bacterium]|nr:ParB/RepB/Spo0J family partition protein [Gammaproteobacteria bacterium]
MTQKKRALGKGLDALLGTVTDISEPAKEGELRKLPVDLVQQSQYQPRKAMNPEALKDLADSIRAQGVVQPILVRPLMDGSDHYEIIAGERRWRAAQMAGLHEIPVVVRDVPDQAAICIALIENIQREDLNPLEEARTLRRLLQEFEMTHETVAESVGRSRSTVTNLLRLLDLHRDVQVMLESGQLEMGHARAIVSLPHEQQPEIAKQVARQGLSVRETERLVSRCQNKGKKKQSHKKEDPNIRHLQDDLSGRLGTRVIIKHNSKGNGTLQIHYNSLDELDGILAKIKKR